MVILKIMFFLLSLMRLDTNLRELNEDISKILFLKAKDIYGSTIFYKGLDVIYSSLESNVINSDSLYELSLKDCIPLLDRIYFLRFPISIANLTFVKSRYLYCHYFSLILSQNDDINKNKEIIEIYDKLDNDLQNDQDLMYMRFEASNKLGDFKGNFNKILENSFAMYIDDLRFFKWFLKKDKFFPSLFYEIQFKEDSFFKRKNIDFIFNNTVLDKPNTIALFAFLKNEINKLNGIQSIYLLKYKLLTPDEAYIYLKEDPPKIISEYKMFYDLLGDPVIKDDFLNYYKNLSGIYFIDNKKDNTLFFDNGILVSFFSKIVNCSMELNLDENYFHKVSFKDKAPIYYENSLLDYRVNYSIYPYVSMIEVGGPDNKYVYIFSRHSFKYEIFDIFNCNFDYVSLNEFVIAGIPEIFLFNDLNLNPNQVFLFDIRSLIDKKTFNNYDVIEINNYSLGNLVSVYKN